MIFKYQVEAVAKDHLELVLENASSDVKKYLLEPSRWNKYLDLLHHRANQVIVFVLARYKVYPTKKQLQDFMTHATNHYIKVQLDLAEKKTDTVKSIA